MKETILGLDLGLTSVGWAVVEVDSKKPGGEIINAGSRIFPATEPAKERRIHRGQRRRLRRLRGRMHAVRCLFIKHNLLGEEFIQTDKDGRQMKDYWDNFVIDNAKISKFHEEQNRLQEYNLWKLRSEGLKRALTPGEWTAVLTQLAKRRGFKSNRKNPPKDEESGVMLKAAQENKALWDKQGYITVGQMLAEDEKFAERKRNKGERKKDESKNSSADSTTSQKAKLAHYTHSLLREYLHDEIKKLFDAQRKYKNPCSSEQFETEYLGIWEEQKPVDSGEIFEMVGFCSFEPKEKRAPRMSYTAERCRVWGDINHRLTICSSSSGRRNMQVTPEEKEHLAKKAEEKEKITYANVRSCLNLNGRGEIFTFKDVSYSPEHLQFRAKIQSIGIKARDKQHASEAQEFRKNITFDMRSKIYNLGMQEMNITFAQVRSILNLDERFDIAKLPKNQDEEEPFFKFAHYAKIKESMPAGLWNKMPVDADSRGEKLAQLAEICMFVAGDEKMEELQAVSDAKTAACLEKLKLSCEEEKEIFTEMKGTNALRKAVKKQDIWQYLQDNVRCMDKIAEAATYYKDDEHIRDYLQQDLSDNDMLEEIKELACGISFQETASLSLKALGKILPYLQKGYKYSEACEEAGYNHSRPQKPPEKQRKLPVIIDSQTVRKKSKDIRKKLQSGEAVEKDIRNPRVLRTLSQARKIVNAIIEQYGDIDKVHIELSRDLAKSPKEQRKIKAGQDKYRVEKEQAVNLIKKHYPGRHFSGRDILKVRLWQAQNERCAYSGEDIKPGDLLAEGALEIDHILPLSRSMDDSQNNKVLCLCAENRKKGNRTPFEYFGDDQERWHKFLERSKRYTVGRQARLSKEIFDREAAEEHMKKWVESPESKWISLEFKNYLENYMKFAGDDDNSDKKTVRRVQTRNGALTAFLRAHWGLIKSRDNHLHHAQDAIVLAVSTNSMVKRISGWSKKNQLRGEMSIVDNEGEVHSTAKFSRKEDFPEPWGNFRNDVLKHCGDIFVSQSPRRKISGGAHLATLKKKHKSGENAPFVRNSNQHGEPEAWSILRTDVFRKNGKFYLSVVYPYHRGAGNLSKEFISRGKSGRSIDSSYEFCFSLFPGDAVSIQQKARSAIKRFPPGEEHAGVKWSENDKFVTIVGYFRTTHSGDARIKIEAHDDSWPQKNISDFCPGVQSLLDLKKLEIPLLGDFSIDDILKDSVINGKHVVKKQGERLDLAKPAGRKRRRA